MSAPGCRSVVHLFFGKYEHSLKSYNILVTPFVKGDVMKRLTSIKDWKSKMNSLADIDSLMDQLYLSSNEENTLANAQLIMELETKLRNIAEVVVLIFRIS